LFVDDSAGNVIGARTAGLRGYEYTDPESFAVELQRHGLLIQPGAQAS
jgi:FMN phosphatase YigB (HAD superfamily)